MKVEYIAAFETGKESIWLKKLYTDMEVVQDMDKPPTLYCDNGRVVANSKELRNYKRGKHIEMKYHLINEIV